MSAQPTLERRRFTVAEYEHMGRTGVLREDERLELLDGEIVLMAPIEPPHAAQVTRLSYQFLTRLDDRAIVRVQNPLRLSLRSEPQPDVTLARPRKDFYVHAHPAPEDALLVVEVADSSLPVDRSVKVPLYAGAGVSEVWVIDLEAARLHVHRSPEGREYTVLQTLRRGDSISPEAFPDVTFAVSELLGP